MAQYYVTIVQNFVERKMIFRIKNLGTYMSNNKEGEASLTRKNIYLRNYFIAIGLFT